MSETYDVTEVVAHLRQNPDAQTRAEAAKWLGEAAPHMAQADYELARSALNDALTDQDPSVLMAAMQALGAFTRHSADFMPAEDAPEDQPLAAGGACALCGKPEMLIQASECEEANCPYR